MLSNINHGRHAVQIDAIGGLHLRGVDVLARYGGEEFAIILPGTSSRSSKMVGERLRRKIAGRPFTINGKDIYLTISLGGATFPEHAAEAHQLVECADRAMYRAKQAGRNCFRLAGE